MCIGVEALELATMICLNTVEISTGIVDAGVSTHFALVGDP